MPVFSVYVLSDGSDKLYVGQTQDLDARMTQHARGACQSTTAFATHTVVNYWFAASRYLALKLECYLQELQRKEGDQALLDLVLDRPDSLPKMLWLQAARRKDTPYQLKFKHPQTKPTA